MSATIGWPWKFECPDWPNARYMRSPVGCVMFYRKLYEDYNFDVYFKRDREEGWVLVHSNVVAENCLCGRAYNDTPNGERFCYLDVEYIPADAHATALEMIRNPKLCYYCFYTSEYKKGHFVPKTFKVDFE